MMRHQEFAERFGQATPFWGVRHLYRSVYLADGPAGRFRAVLATVIVLLPAVGFGAWSLIMGPPAALVWSLLAFAAFLAARTDASCAMGCLWVMTGLLAALVSVVLGDRAHLIGAPLALFAYVAGSVFRGVTVSGLGERLRDSEALYTKFLEADELFFLGPPERPA